SGGLEFSAGKVSLTLSGLELNTATDKVTAAFSDIHITAFRLDTSSASFVRARGGGELTNIVVKLAKPGAEKLNSLLGTHTFKPGTVLGVASVDVDPVEYVVSGNKTTLTVASDASSALASLGITTGVGDGASVNENGSISFPITGGKVNVAGYDGRILHAGALTLTRGSTVVSLSSFTINTQKNQLSGLVNGAGPAYLLNLTEPENQLLDDDGRLEQNNITASLSAPAARALNEAFGTTAFTEGMILGYINTDIQLY
ncbi:MAG: hypothetical protein QOF76_2830, partial [Solirubrobacteraceae bacterium]|nr:hypothetical protein [Solirubrobacteraceae bacterium]